MATVILAGFNADIGRLSTLDPLPTPETISAAYARISRDPRPVPELRASALAEVEAARASNRRIVFGFGHHSVAEHAVLNVDILDVSRLAVEALQSHRLASFTEKSQRYVRLAEGFVQPPEAQDDDALRAYFSRCFHRYGSLAAGLEGSGMDPRLAGEDARYVLPLATATQLGMTVNARELETMIRDFSEHPLAEVRDLGARLFEAGTAVVPSLLRHVAPRGRGPIEDIHGMLGPTAPATDRVEPPVRLVAATPEGDEIVLAALVAPEAGLSLSETRDRIRRMDVVARQRLLARSLHGLTAHDPAPRAFEHAALTFDLILSAAAFGQLKRHRMLTATVSPYDPGLSFTVPPSVERAGLRALLEEAAADASEQHQHLGARKAPQAAYALLNAHRRRVVVTVNLRELVLFSRLREDAHAQWDIRDIAHRMTAVARETFPVCAGFLGGKDAFFGAARPH